MVDLFDLHEEFWKSRHRAFCVVDHKVPFIPTRHSEREAAASREFLTVYIHVYQSWIFSFRQIAVINRRGYQLFSQRQYFFLVPQFHSLSKTKKSRLWRCAFGVFLPLRFVNYKYQLKWGGGGGGGGGGGDGNCGETSLCAIKASKCELNQRKQTR